MSLAGKRTAMASRKRSSSSASSASSVGQCDDPQGGTDRSKLPSDIHPGWTVRITFHSARGLPPADLGLKAGSLTSDPFMHCTMKDTGLPKRHAEDPRPTFRTRTLHNTMEPEWEASWTIANCPEKGFEIKARIYDEDPQNHDDRLGNAHIHIPQLSHDFQWDHHEVPIKRRSGSWRAYGAQRVHHAFSSQHHEDRPVLVVSVQCLGRTDSKTGAKAYTIAPNYAFRHYSPLIGRLAGTKGGDEDEGVQKYDFEANQLQLSGPVPDELYQRFVAFKPWVGPMFKARGFKGKTLHYLLRHQHERIYNFDAQTTYAIVEEGPGPALASQLLKAAHYDEGGRIFTYVLLLDGLLRFTETGKEFGVDLLSKHTMHSRVSTYIACSGEFYIRRVKNAEQKGKSLENQEAHPPTEINGGPPNDPPPRDPTLYELIIDNDSGTYRPAADLLPLLQSYLESQLKPMRVIAMDCSSDETQELKEQQRDIKRREGDKRIFVQPGSIASSDSDSDRSDAEHTLEDRIQSMDVADDKEGAAAASQEAHEKHTTTSSLKKALLKPKVAFKQFTAKAT